MIKNKINYLLTASMVVCSLAIMPTVYADNNSVVTAKSVSSHTNIEAKMSRTVSETGIVTAPSGLNLRKSASTSSTIIKTLVYNSSVNIKGQTGNWYYVEQDGFYGYVSSSWIKLSLNSSSNAVGTITAPSGLNLRKSASTSSSIITTLPYGSKIDIISDNGSWYYVKYNNSYGYVNASWVSKGNSTVENVGAVTAPSGLNLRKSASTSSTIITTLPYGAKVNIKSTSGNWHYVEYNGMHGYVSTAWVAKGSINSSTTGGAENNTVTMSTGTVTAPSGLNLRKSASTSSSIIKTLPYGTKVNIKSTSGDWYYIECNGTYGYVSTAWVAKGSINSSTTGGAENNTVTMSTGTVTAPSGLNLRKSASTSSSIIKTLPYGTKVNIKSTSGDWYYIECNGTYGYVSSAWVQTGILSEVTGTQSKYQQVLSVMKAQIGSPYVWGGNGEFITYDSIAKLRKKFPDADSKGWYDKIDSKYYNAGYRAFDCSSLMQWSFAQAGINISRTTYSQIYDGVAVSKSNVQPGDLLIYSNEGHVGMYIGDNKWIEAPYSGAYVRIADVPWSKIGYIRRVL